MFHLVIPENCPTGALEVTLFTRENYLIMVLHYMSLQVVLSYCPVTTLHAYLWFISCKVSIYL